MRIPPVTPPAPFDPRRTRAPRGRRGRAAVAASLGVALTLTLGGCASAMDSLQHVHSESFPDLPAAQAGWVGVSAPGWIPSDAEEIRTTATNDESNAVIAVDGGSEPIGCEEAPRQSLPFDGRYGGFTSGDELPATVLRCGPYEVVETDAGWLGWFTATEQGQTPDDA